MSLVLFDFDGVLADTLADMLRFTQQVCDELGVKHTVIESDISELEVMSFATLGRACGTPEELVDEFARRCPEKFAAKQSPSAILDGLADVVRKLAQDHALVVVSGNTEEVVRSFLEEYELEDCFLAVYGLDMPGSKAEKIIMAKSLYAATDDMVFMVGDSISDLRAAQEAGVKSIAVTWGHQNLGLLIGAVPDHVINSPGELTEVIQRAQTH